MVGLLRKKENNQIDENDLVPDYISMSIDKNGLPIIVIKEEEEEEQTDWEFDENGDYNF